MLFKGFFLLFLFFLPLCGHCVPGYIVPWGKDADLVTKVPLPQSPPLPLASRFAIKVIRFHQTVLSPVDGPRSHFYPCSSTYALHAIKRHGFIKGFLMGCDRLLRENGEAWHYPVVCIDNQLIKYDPVPDAHRPPKS